ncbi:MAG: GNAT family N-acetyltransferase [Bacteroidota bacterium]
MQIIVRKGRESDIAATLNLIRELAHFELAPDEVEVTESQMLNWGFGQEKIFDFFVAEKNNTILGMALYYYKYSTWKGKCIFLEDIIVTKNARREGIGKLLFDEVLKVAKREKVKRLEWQVLNWNTDAIAFYENYNANLDNEWSNGKLVYNQIQAFNLDQ